MGSIPNTLIKITRICKRVILYSSLFYGFIQPHSVPHKAPYSCYKNVDVHGYIAHTKIFKCSIEFFFMIVMLIDQITL